MIKEYPTQQSKWVQEDLAQEPIYGPLVVLPAHENKCIQLSKNEARIAIISSNAKANVRNNGCSSEPVQRQKEGY